MGSSTQTSFSSREIRYLLSLPAVRSASATRITYSDKFKEYCMRRYEMGDSPAQIFRDAGLDSSLIGYKRIERAFARWRRDGKRTPRPDSGSDEGMTVSRDRRWEAHSPDEGEGRLTRDDLTLIIAQQARRIDRLEHEIDTLRGTGDAHR